MELRSGNVYDQALRRADRERESEKKVAKRRQRDRLQDRRERTSQLLSEKSSVPLVERRTAARHDVRLAPRATRAPTKWRMKPGKTGPAPSSGEYDAINLDGNIWDKLAQLRSKSEEIGIGSGFWFNTGINFPGMGGVSHFAFLEKVGDGKFVHYDNNGEPAGAGWTGAQRPQYARALERAVGEVDSGSYDASFRYIQNVADQGGKLSLGRFSREYLHPMGGEDGVLDEVTIECRQFGAFCINRSMHPRLGLAAFKDSVFDVYEGVEGDAESKAGAVGDFIAAQDFPRPRRGHNK